MARYDKYDGKVGGFRAPLAADFGYTSSNPDFSHADLGTAFAVGLDGTGRLVKGGGSTGVLGVLILTEPKAAGDAVDVMTAGEIVEFGGTAATAYFADATTGGTDGAAPAAGAFGTRLGVTVEGDRLVVRVAQIQA